MNQFERSAGWSSPVWKVVLGLGLAAGLLAGAPPASASPITSIKDALDRLNLPGFGSTSQEEAFQTFLAGGPDLWSRTRLMRIPEGAPILGPRGELRDNRVVEYLAWGRARDPELFDRRHPLLGAKLAAAGSLGGTQASTTPSATGAIATVEAGPPGPTTASPQAQMLQPPRIAPEALTPPIPSTGLDSPTPERSSSSAATSHVLAPINPSLEGEGGSPAPVPEPSTAALILLLLGAAAWWNRRPSGGRSPEVC